MTNRDFFEAIINGNVSEEVIVFAENTLERLNKRNEHRKNMPSKASVENAPIKEKIIEKLGSRASLFASDVAQELEISVQKASALLRQLVEEGRAIVEEVKVPKKGKVKSYKAK